jgi:hypothetical protein
LQLDDQLKRLLRELGHAINDTVGDSDRISEAIAGVRAAGYDIVLKLDATIGLARRESQSARLNPNDRRFLESLHIQVDHESLEEEPRPVRKVEMTPQDLSFLKSLKISVDSQEED